MKSKQCNERARVKAVLRNSESEFPPHRFRDQAIAQREAALGKQEGLPLEMIEAMAKQSIRDAYRVIAVTNLHINKSTSLITRHRSPAKRVGTS